MADEDEPTEMLVDPAVSRAKFAREITDFHACEDRYIQRGIWLVKAEFPSVLVIFGIPQLKPPAVLFGAALDFTNYDLWPPSVQVVDPFSQHPHLTKELPSRLKQWPSPEQAPAFVIQGPDGTPLPLQQVEVMTDGQALMQGPEDGVPFLCLRGVREYHAHPAHTGDDWLLYRGTGTGSLAYIIEQLHKYGVAPITDYHRQIVVRIAGFAQQPMPA